MLKRLLFVISLTLISTLAYAQQQTAIFAVGCFWCGQSDFDKVPGVIQTIAGFDGGRAPNPSYKQVSSGTTNYVESVKVIYDSKKVSYQQLLDYFWHHIDPTVKDAQFCDHGRQYQSVIFYLNPAQQQQALASSRAVKKQFPVVYTEINPSTRFYPAEEYHQDYYKKNPWRYEFYRWNCGRDTRLKEVWDGK